MTPFPGRGRRGGEIGAAPVSGGNFALQNCRAAMRQGLQRKARRLCVGLAGAVCGALTSMQHSKAEDLKRKARFAAVRRKGALKTFL